MPAAQATQTSTTAAELVLVSEPSLGVESIALSSGRWTVGSSDENRIVVREPGIADQHCLLLVTGEQILMKSWSGQTRVNGRPQQEAYVRAGDVLTFGDADFQIRRADSTQSDGEESQRTGSIVGQIETLAEIVEEPNREFAGRCTEVDRLDQMIARIQAGLEKSATSEDTITRLRSQIVELQQTATAEAEKENASRHQTDDSENDLRIQAAQQNLDQIIHGLEEEELAFGDPGFERQLSLRVQHKLRQLESVSASLQGRAAVLEQQAIELDGQRSQYGEWRPEAGHDSESSLNGLPESHEEDSSFDASPENDSQFSDHAFGNDEAPGEYGSFAEPVSEDSGFDSPLKKGSDPLDDVEKQGKTGRPERVRPLFQRTVKVATSSHGETDTPVETGATDDESASFTPDVTPKSDLTPEQDSEDDALHSYVTEQRAKLRQLMEGFEPFQVTQQDGEAATASVEETGSAFEEAAFEESSTSLDDLAEEEASEIREAVTAAVLGGASPLGEVVGARRSRDEAIRQLDDLIREANDESLRDVLIPKLPNSEPSHGAEDPPTVASTDTVTEGETAWDGARVGSFEVDLEDDSVDADSTAMADTNGSIEATLDFASEQLELLSDFAETRVEEEGASENKFGSGREFETGDTGTAVESCLTAEDAAEEDADTEFPSSFDWSAGTFGGTDDTPSFPQGPKTELGDSSVDAADSTELPDSRTSFGHPETETEEGSSVAESQELKENTAEETVDPESRVDELRSQLAQMFDLPASSSVAGDTLSQIAEEASAQNGRFSTVAEDDVEPEGVSDSPSVTSESTRDDVSLPGEIETQQNQTGEATAFTESADPGTQEPESISAYMDALLARNRKQSGDDRPKYDAPPTPSPETGLVSERILAEPVTGGESEERDSLDRSWLTEGPKHKQDRAAVRASLTTLREVANNSARSAVAQASKAQLRWEILTLTGASLICLAFAIAAALFKVNPLLPLAAVGLSLFFAVKLGNEIRHSWAIMRHAKSAVTDDTSRVGDALTPDEVIDQKASE